MDPEILRRKGTANGNGITTNGQCISPKVTLSAAVNGAMKSVDGLVASGATDSPAINGVHRIADGIAA